MGIKLEWTRVLEIAGEAAPGRPHVAQALVEGGFVASFREAFARYLHNDGPAYVEVRHCAWRIDAELTVRPMDRWMADRTNERAACGRMHGW